VAPIVLTAHDVAAAAGATVVSGGSRSFDSFSIDSRTLAPGQCFIALKGDRFDGAA
jgi:UDP-N-acetylmuramyl pentapeptide synthase